MADAAPAGVAPVLDAPASIRVRRAASDWWPDGHELAQQWEQDSEVRGIFRKMEVVF